MAFEALLGNDRLKKNLAESLARGHISHFYLISGPEGSGKHTLAHLLAEAILCEGSRKSCGSCVHCRKMASGGKLIVVEEVCGKSGIYQEISHEIRKIDANYQVYGVDLGHGFCVHGATAKLYEHYGLDGASLAKFAQEVCGIEN